MSPQTEDFINVSLKLQKTVKCPDKNTLDTKKNLLTIFLYQAHSTIEGHGDPQSQDPRHFLSF